MKTPKQIKNEVEKEIERLTKELIGWEGKIVIEIKGTKFNVLENHNKFVEITNLDRLKAKLSILTEYDKSIKEMIGNYLDDLYFCKFDEIKFYAKLRYKEDMKKKFEEIFDFWNIKSKELLSKIGEDLTK